MSPQGKGTKSTAIPQPPTEEVQLASLLWEVTTYAILLEEETLADTPLTVASSKLLQSVSCEPGITVAELARRIPKSPQAISRIVARLEKLGFVERRVRAG